MQLYVNLIALLMLGAHLSRLCVLTEMKHVFMLLSLMGFLTSGCAGRLAKMSDVQKAELLTTQRGKLPDIKDPVAKTKTYITISRVLLDFVAGSAQEGDTVALHSLLKQYVSAINDARKSIVDSDRDPLRRPAGYKDLEITLRDHERRLRDIANSLNFDERAPIEGALESVNSVRSEMLRLLFPQRSATSNLLR